MTIEECKHIEELVIERDKKVLVEMIDEWMVINLQGKIMKISNLIHRDSRYRAADTVMVNPKLDRLVQVNNMNVILDEGIPEDLVFVKSSIADDLKVVFILNEEKLGGEIPTITLKGLKDCTDDEIRNYRMGLKGYIRIIKE